MDCDCRERTEIGEAKQGCVIGPGLIAIGLFCIGVFGPGALQWILVLGGSAVGITNAMKLDKMKKQEQINE